METLAQISSIFIASIVVVILIISFILFVIERKNNSDLLEGPLYQKVFVVTLIFLFYLPMILFFFSEKLSNIMSENDTSHD